jgi:hypothetical protein
VPAYHVRVAQLPATHVGNGTHSTTVAGPPPHSSGLPVEGIAGGALVLVILGAIAVRMIKRPRNGDSPAR